MLELIGGRTAATVKLPGKLINNESPPGSLDQSGRARKDDAGGRRRWDFY